MSNREIAIVILWFIGLGEAVGILNSQLHLWDIENPWWLLLFIPLSILAAYVWLQIIKWAFNQL